MNKREALFLIGWAVLSMLMGLLCGLNENRCRKLEKRVVALEQEIARQDCEKEAQAVGAAYVFIANGTESECYPLYSD